ncbi:type III pantothenate kinase [Aeromicrobium wangtongii]|uniref:Type III pantothenate kinase n=1 Tax=Aeromicrobium wangtongii TaxID=2969247 RepID=A0ABY5M8A0_9ACTN|nr:type III pantothenate kinase [Aeromicrobium wangtongii]MCD9200088.1 type III pantothenate kinase [Aeromicrobium wangtongii]UUP13344.1 type III pantothenate kinase [Aeromicrobium wangtongii]
MILLCLDVSNSHTSIGAFDMSAAPTDEDGLIEHWQVSSDERRTADEWQVLITGLAARSGIDSIDAVSMCCTVPSILVELRSMQERYYAGLPVAVVGPGVKTGIPIHTDNPREVGADRIVNALAAAELYGGPAIVVDLNGTATIFDVIDADNRYVGGAIAPGVELSLEALASRGAQLRSVELAVPRDVVGKNTVEALQSGLVFGFAGLVDGMVNRIIDSLGADPDHVTVIATGSFPGSVVDHCETITTRDPYLTLTGLRLIHDKNHG